MVLLLFGAIGADKGAYFGTNQIEISQDVIFPVIKQLDKDHFLGFGWSSFSWKSRKYFEETSSQALKLATLVTGFYPKVT